MKEQIEKILKFHNKVDSFDDGDYSVDSISDSQATESILKLFEEAEKDYKDMRMFQAKFIKADQALREIGNLAGSPITTYHIPTGSQEKSLLLEKISEIVQEALATPTFSEEKENHCKDCCCAESWKALGITKYDGLSIPEHISVLKAELFELKGGFASVGKPIPAEKKEKETERILSKWEKKLGIKPQEQFYPGSTHPLPEPKPKDRIEELKELEWDNADDTLWRVIAKEINKVIQKQGEIIRHINKES